MNKKTELFVSIITLASIIVILIPSVHSLTSTKLDIIYIFDLIVVVILGVDFYIRLKESGQGSRFILTQNSITRRNGTMGLYRLNRIKNRYLK